MIGQQPLGYLAGDPSAAGWNEVRPLLHSIERYAEKTKNYAAWVARYTSMLPARPDFETRAAESLAKAEDELRIALSAVRAAREHYDRLPIMAAAAE